MMLNNDDGDDNGDEFSSQLSTHNSKHDVLTIMLVYYNQIHTFVNKNLMTNLILNISRHGVHPTLILARPFY